MKSLEFYFWQWGKKWIIFLIKLMFIIEKILVTYLGMELLAVDKGMAKLSMVATKDKHSNLLGVTHGGAIMSLADTAMGAACITNGKKQ